MRAESRCRLQLPELSETCRPELGGAEPGGQAGRMAPCGHSRDGDTREQPGCTPATTSSHATHPGLCQLPRSNKPGSLHSHPPQTYLTPSARSPSCSPPQPPHPPACSGHTLLMASSLMAPAPPPPSPQPHTAHPPPRPPVPHGRARGVGGVAPTSAWAVPLARRVAARGLRRDRCLMAPALA